MEQNGAAEQKTLINKQLAALPYIVSRRSLSEAAAWPTSGAPPSTGGCATPISATSSKSDSERRRPDGLPVAVLHSRLDKDHRRRHRNGQRRDRVAVQQTAHGEQLYVRRANETYGSNSACCIRRGSAPMPALALPQGPQKPSTHLIATVRSRPTGPVDALGYNDQPSASKRRSL